jgi:hypothetical protein
MTSGAIDVVLRDAKKGLLDTRKDKKQRKRKQT